MFGLFDKKKSEENKNKEKQQASKFVVLLILDGFGVHPDPEGNAVLGARTPFLDTAWTYGKSTLLNASGTYVGLPSEEAGNSEVGHLNLGAGQVVYQSYPRINDAITTHELDRNVVLRDAFSEVKSRGSNVHLAGVLSPAGVHGHIKHLFSLMDICKANGLNPYIHVFFDGRDTPPKDGFLYLNKLNEKIRELGIGKIASIQGRFYAMDRDNRWERIKLAYDAMVGLSPDTFLDPVVALQSSYANNITDEFVKPSTAIDSQGVPIGAVRSNDILLLWNFREDRARELSKAFISKEFDHFVRRNYPENLYLVTMTGYEEGIDAHVIFPPREIELPIAEYISNLGFNQLHISETEKNMHVTYFFNGGVEQNHPGEDFFNIPSQRVENYATVPQMSSPIIRDEVVKRIKAYDTYKYKFIVINFANPDMLGHTGDYNATVMGNEIVDQLTADIAKVTLSMGGALVITADHGNCESMVNRVTKEVDIAHTNNPVPLVVLSSIDEITPKPGDKMIKIGTGKNAQTTGLLADIAPTCLGLIGLDIPDSMTGVDLRNIF